MAVLGVGDVGNVGDDEAAWTVATQAIYQIEDPSLTATPEGIPYSLTVGNHDQVPMARPSTRGGASPCYNAYFGLDHFAGRSYDGEHFSTNRNNHTMPFSASGLDFLVLSIEYDTSPEPVVMAWGEGVLNSNPACRAILATHIATADYRDQFLDNANLLLIAYGHLTASYVNTTFWDEYGAYTLATDYQGAFPYFDTLGRVELLTFSPSNNTMHVQTYSTVLGQYRPADIDTLVYYDLQELREAIVGLGSVTGVVSAGNAAITWSNLAPLSVYEWYAVAWDGISGGTTSEVFRFTTRGPEGDFDGDTLPDWWETLYGLNPSNAVGRDGTGGDPDSDGMSNRAEYRADTDPTNGASRLQITAIYGQDSDLSLSWKGGIAATQYIEYSAGLVSTALSWSVVGAFSPPTPAVNSTSHVSPAASGFYRLRVP